MGPVLLSNETQFNGIIWPDHCNGNRDFSNESGGSLEYSTSFPAKNEASPDSWKRNKLGL